MIIEHYNTKVTLERVMGTKDKFIVDLNTSRAEKGTKTLVSIMDTAPFLEYTIALTTLSSIFQELSEIQHSDPNVLFTTMVDNIIGKDVMDNLHISTNLISDNIPLLDLNIWYNFKKTYTKEMELLDSGWLPGNELVSAYTMIMDAYSTHRTGFLKLVKCKTAQEATFISEKLIQITKEFEMLIKSYNHILNTLDKLIMESI